MKKTTNFTHRVRTIVRNIPKGKTLTYGQVAAIAGSPNAARAVGSIMRKNTDNEIPCHRVVGAHGAIGGYNRGGVEAKRALLLMEGALQDE